MKCFQFIFVLLLTALMARMALGAPTTRPISWQPWSDDVFAQAKRENKFVLLDLHAVWCHWCHVMDDTTYSDPKVIALINSKFIAVGVDADARPDLADRYEDYGWPATIVFGPDGKEIVKRRGYLFPKQMASMLQEIIDDPTPGPSVREEAKITFTNQSALSEKIRKMLVQRLSDSYDNKYGSWGTVQKFLDWDSAEWCLRRAAAGDKEAERMARQTLDGQMNLIDPIWGGVDQYSTDGDWDHPHYEKIMQFQAENLRIYSLAYEQFHNPADLKAASAIHGYLTNFLLSADGAFYTSQDADLGAGESGNEYYKLSDTQRRAMGIPRIDQHQYARENGWAICGLLAYYGATADKSALDQAISAADWIIEHRALKGGGFRHDENDPAGPYLADTLAMGRAVLALYQATADRAWLVRAGEAADFISAHFVRSDAPGVTTTAASASQVLGATVEFDENVSVARFANLLAYYTGKQLHKDLATSALRYITTPQIASARRFALGGLLLADAEASSLPVHIVIVGSKQSAEAAALFTTALGVPNAYKRLEWYDASEGPLPNADVEYPVMNEPAAFVCSGTACSRPAFTSAELMKRLER
jgi:uncharacterized protein YyaL (SSP411 family)